jgi:hypothetical protein
MPAALLDEDDQRYLRAFIDHLRKTGWNPPSLPVNMQPDGSGDEPFFVPSFIGKVNENLDAGTVISESARFQPMYGPEHPLTDTPCAAAFKPNRAWYDVSTDQWAAAYQMFGKWYVLPTECAPPV